MKTRWLVHRDWNHNVVARLFDGQDKIIIQFVIPQFGSVQLYSKKLYWWACSLLYY